MAVGNDVGAAALPSSSELALDRTLLAHDRTLMAWIRTAVSLISFGFTIYKFFQYPREQQGLEPDGRVLGPRRFADRGHSSAITLLLPASIYVLCHMAYGMWR